MPEMRLHEEEWEQTLIDGVTGDGGGGGRELVNLRALVLRSQGFRSDPKIVPGSGTSHGESGRREGQERKGRYVWGSVNGTRKGEC